MITTRIRSFLHAALAAVLAACSGDGPSVTPPEPPVPGQLTVTLATPNSDDRALQAIVTGPGEITAVESPATGVAAFSRPTAGGVSVAIFGHLGNGAVLRFTVPDVNRASAYAASVQEVADASNALRPSLAGYQLTVAK
ncbi:MAG TPA: hypothetical protein VFS20_01845 [Longimicrobium sp.]|nr:hypothetical protein [Longimicrobium sp.]